MCGLAGWISARERPQAQAQCRIDQLRRNLLRRGPDGDGSRLAEGGRVGFVHTRLAILDPLARSDQPLVDGQTGAFIAYNGEIYNFRALRSDLQAAGVAFETAGDTEVILKGYLHEGESFFRKLRGMYAFVIYDPRTRQAVALRDPFGIKPLYVRQTADGVLFGSSARDLAAIDTPCRLDPAAAVSLVTLGCVLEPLSCFEGVAMIDPSVAHTWRLTPDGVETGRTPIEPALAFTANAARPSPAELEAALDDTVRAHFEADVEVAVLQSGGVDSTLVSALAVRAGLDPFLVTLGFDEFRGGPLDEIPAAGAIASKLGLRHHGVYLGQTDFAGLRQRFLADMESPTIDAINTYLVTMVCRRLGLKVALSGVGGDELFAGYPSFRTLPRLYRLRHLLTAPGPRQAANAALGRMASSARHAPKLGHLTGYLDSFARLYLFQRAVFLPEQAAQVLHPDIVQAGMPLFLKAYDGWSKGADHGGLADVRQLERDVYMRNMLLRDADWAGMANGVEVRTPFVDIGLHRRLVDPRNRCGYDKSDLRKLLTRLDPAYGGGPRRKLGFAIPYKAWFEPDDGRDGHGARGIQHWCREVAGAFFPDWTL